MWPRCCYAGLTGFICLRWGLGGVALPWVGFMYVVAGAEPVLTFGWNGIAQKSIALIKECDAAECR